MHFLNKFLDYINEIPYALKQDNVVLAYSILTEQFKALAVESSAYKTWQDQAELYQTQIGKDVNAYQLFMTYFLAKYIDTLGSVTVIKPYTLSNGCSKLWEDRDTRVWS